ncbi:shikimate dehydrogenase [Agrilactobacillus yilanensis]|uniref:Shikimate dehydrogenase (NADP(+)) n=1 Tax=Agrilactobacillus yilanensis TaxID=2485997 RepID=A0ABW4J9J2_9LACO|nr:shikimate dehydrogenase [Agrilactobacillus yilanensis]
MVIDAKTKLYGLLAHPCQHSMSPLMHNTAFAHHQLNSTYLAFDVLPENIEAALAGMRAMGVAGVNLSMPLKTAVLPYLDDIEPAAKLIGAVNTIKNDHGRLTGYNTDGLGLLQALAPEFEPKGAQIAILGAGGAAKSVAVHCALAGVKKITIFNRHIGPGSRADALQQLLATGTEAEVEVYALDNTAQLKQTLGQVALLVNATNLGMGTYEGQSPLPTPAVFSKDIIVFDMIYAPRETALLKSARAAGLTRVHNGIGMLIQQGAAAFKIWTGEEMPISLVKEKLELN